MYFDGFLYRIMRILRIFKLVRHFAGLQSLLITLQQVEKSPPRHKKIGNFFAVLFEAYKELGLLLVLIVVAILVYSSLVYFAERDSSSHLGEMLSPRNFFFGKKHFCVRSELH